MIKTIKVKKQMRLDELIKYVRDNGINSQDFVTDVGRASVYFDSEQRMSFVEYVYGDFGIDRTFTVEVEEEITEDTEFQTLVAADAEGDACLMYKGTIDEIRDSITTEIYANINGKLQLIWEAESDVK